MDTRSKVVTHDLTCALCGVVYAPAVASIYDLPGLCNSCVSRDHLRELDRVQSALRQAERQHQPATLTLTEWLSIISAWNGHCALCEITPYQVLAIWTYAGGCVKENCVPLCRVCEYHRQNSFLSAMQRVGSFLQPMGDEQITVSQ